MGGGDENHLFDVPIVIVGTVSMIFCDGYTMTCQKGVSVAWGHTLNIFGQKNNTGTLVATGTDYGAGIGSPKKINAGDVNIYGGKVTAKGGDGAAGIGSANGSVYFGFGYDEYSWGTISIYGGEVNATASDSMTGRDK